MSLVALAREHLDQLQPRLSAAERSFRDSAWSQVQRLGLPNRKTETWKYSNLAGLEKMSWNVGSVKATLPEAWSKWLSTLSTAFSTAVFVNGEFVANQSHLPSELEVRSADITGFRGEDGFSHLNASIAEPGYRLSLGAGKKLSRPLILLNYQSAGGAWTSRLNQIHIGAGAHLEIIEIWAGDANTYFRSDLTEARVESQGHLSWVRHQRESAEAFHFNETHVGLATGSRLHFTQVNRGARWYRGQMQVNIEGREAIASVHGLTFGQGEQHIDQRLVMNHLVGENESHQLFKGVFKERAKGALNGKIYIARDAQKVNSMQMNHNLLLSPGAEANTKPELEIYADDVKANHGATVGRLDEEKMFYLRSRGLTAATAESLLSEAFAGDVYMKIPIAGARALVEVNHGP